MHQSRMFGWPGADILGDGFMQSDKAVEATMDVADGINSLSGRQGGGGGDEFDHDC